MANRLPPFVWRSGAAVFTVALALLLALSLIPILESAVFVLFYLAVLVSALMGGWSAGLVSVGLSALVSKYFLIAPLHTLVIADRSTLLWMATFILLMVLVCGISATLRKAREETKLSLQQLKLSEERFRLALSSPFITIFQQDRDLRYQWIHNFNTVSSAAYETILGQTDDDLFPQEADRLTAIKRRVLGKGIPAREELPLTIDGEKRWYDLLVEPVYEHGRVTGISCAALDITERVRVEAERKRAEAALQESDKRFRRLVESNLFGVAFGDFSGAVQYANDAFLHMVGYSREELAAGKVSWLQMTPPEYFSLDQKAGEELRERGICTPYEKEYICKNGSRIPLLVGAALFQEVFDQQDYLVCFYLNLSETKRLEEVRDRVIAAHQQTEKALRVANERFELATVAVKGLVYDWDLTRNYIERTRGLEELTGYTLEEAEPTQEWWANLVHPDDLARLYQLAEEMRSHQDTHYTVEYRIRHRDGTYRYVWDRASIERDASGEIVRIVGFNFDISERKRAEEALRESEERFRAMADGAPVLIWMAGTDQKCFYFNQPWLDFRGRSLEQEMGDSWLEGVHPDDAQRCESTYKTAFQARQPFSMDYRLKRHDGEYRWIVDNGIPRFTPDGTFIGYIGSCIDITERKRSEQAQRYLAEASQVLSSSLDYQTTLASVAQLTVPHLADWCTVHIVTEDGSIQPLETAHVDPDKVAWAKEINQKYPLDQNAPNGVPQVLRTGEPELYTHIPDQLLVLAAQDEAHLKILRDIGFASAMIVPMKVGDRILGVMSFIAAESGRHYDQSDLDLAEELARRAALAVDNAQLYQTAQRDRAKADAANRTKDEFLATLSHELRTPLNAVLGWTQMLRNRQLDPATAERALETMERNTRSLATIIDDLLDVSRIVTGKLSLRICPVDLRAVVEAAIGAVRPAAIAKDISLIFQASGLDGVASTLPPVLGDADRLQQVIWNLLSNAVKFTPKGGQVSIQILQVRRAGGDDSIQIEVSDTGQGISPDFLPYVFDRFRQADSSTTRTYSGLGLGLAIARHLVEMQGGTIWATSQGKGQGSTFTVLLPLALSEEPFAPDKKLEFEDIDAQNQSLSWQPSDNLKQDGETVTGLKQATLVSDQDNMISVSLKENDAFAHVAQNAEPSLAGLRILVVDDEPDARILIATILEQHGAVVVTAASSAEAIALLSDRSRFCPDVLVSDIGMPEEDGYSLIRKIRAMTDQHEKPIPSVALTAYTRSQDRTQALLAGFQQHLAKPVNPQELAIVVATVAKQQKGSSPSILSR